MNSQPCWAYRLLAPRWACWAETHCYMHLGEWLGPAAKVFAAIGPSYDRRLPTKKLLVLSTTT